MFLIYFLMSFGIVSNTLNLQYLGVHYCLQEKFHVQHSTLGVLNVPFVQPSYSIKAHLKVLEQSHVSRLEWFCLGYIRSLICCL
jgi:hypothetical protein